ncbi:dTDP-4-amino-4,6-dideoxygalactose transaminase [Mitsuaria sp. RG]|jgi:dTDP-4-amino-4,6-dideoxygalactose transaminase|uniref:dTDP-4-amino-4,6-dideoxygalactose transaminase n=1 Tax=Pseudomonas sp. AA27 TaxID=2908652 RepID=UPI001F20D74E|nr:dTDP-4-amino-4,6-dideoxygalactose transaminase [Pseudomonas sp. AA27]MCF1489507.1 dTDP-4-amino-4,6-dideoxygalactose transaminase [Pseudomonas sp. AA27]MDC0686570.1 dTDP-4-amino-4,6-dideoxygalactose transaminase [Mitsuaria sp. RG]
MIPFNKPPHIGNEDTHVLAAMRSDKMSGDGAYGHKCQQWFEERFSCHKTLLTPSCTQALEMAALLLDIKPGDEVIMPSYTFVSTANAFVLRGATIVFVDVRPDTMNIDETLIEAAVTPRTRAIVPVHYAGVACEMDVIMDIAKRHNLYVVEDAAQAMMSTYHGKALGTIGHMAAFSFHETKNYTSGGEGGLLLINDPQFIGRAEVIREKGTNRSQFFRGMIDKYTWVDVGSSYLPSELQAAYLYGQLEKADEINQTRLSIWQRYWDAFQPLVGKGLVELGVVPEGCRFNAHMFFLKVRDLQHRTSVLSRLRELGIGAVFHYIPLHSAPAGKSLGRFHGVDNHTTRESERLLRLPLWIAMSDEEVQQVIDAVVKSIDVE